MKYGIIICLLTFQVSVYAQVLEKDPEISRKERFKRTFLSTGLDGQYLGYGLNRDLGVTSQAITIKTYVAYYSVFSAHLGYRQLQPSENHIPWHNLNMGMSLNFLGTDINYYFGNDRSFFTIMPKISLDIRSLSFEYGYQLGKTEGNSHLFKFNYFILLNSDDDYL